MLCYGMRPRSQKFEVWAGSTNWASPLLWKKGPTSGGQYWAPVCWKPPYHLSYDQGTQILHEHFSIPKGPSTPCFRFLVPNATLLMVPGTRDLKCWVLGPSGYVTIPA